tara:strand:+ start:410 stop:850 length:441 start_codon:yes stop_codon:yes gene_type:complete
MAQLQQSHLMNFTAQPMGRTISGNAVQSNSIVAITNAGRGLGSGVSGGSPDDYQPKGSTVPNESYTAAAEDVLVSETAAQKDDTSDGDYQQYVPAGLQQIMNDNALLPGGFIQYRPGQMMSNGRLATLQTLSAADAAAQPPAPASS